MFALLDLLWAKNHGGWQRVGDATRILVVVGEVPKCIEEILGQAGAREPRALKRISLVLEVRIRSRGGIEAGALGVEEG
jgi:hypothetical protein